MCVMCYEGHNKSVWWLGVKKNGGICSVLGNQQGRKKHTNLIDLNVFHDVSKLQEMENVQDNVCM